MAGLFSARDHQAALRVTTAAEIFFRYSKWHRLNQEVEKTTRRRISWIKFPISVTLTRVFGQKQPVRAGFGLRIRNTFTVSVFRGYCEKASDTSAVAL